MSKKKHQHSDNLSDYLGPRYWPTWFGYGCIWCLAHLPFSWQMQLGKWLGLLTYRLAGRRRHICEVNIALCFPELNAGERQKLVRDTFISNGIGIMEIGMAWCRPPHHFKHRTTVNGLDELIAAHQQGRGVLLVGAHFSTIEITGSLMSQTYPIDCTYRAHKNPLFDLLQKRGRERLFGAVVERKQVRKALRRLQEGHIMWYAADQDYGPKHSVFADFFGNPAATITATTKFASFNQSPVIVWGHHRTPDNRGYVINFQAPLTGYPSGDEHRDASRINKLLEAQIRKAPEQYIWLHRRFKTQPPGAPDPYKKSGKAGTS